MHKGTKLRVLAFLVIPALMVQLAVIPTPAWAMENPKEVAQVTAEAGQISLEKAIGIVKSLFTIPAEFVKFTSGYNSYNDRQAWVLNWTTADEGKGGSFSAQVDAMSGEILSMNIWRNFNKPGPTFQLPLVEEPEAKAKALELVNKLAKDKMSDLQFVTSVQGVVPLTSYGPVNYTFTWQRVLNGVPVPTNRIVVQINALNGEPAGYSINWSNVSAPDAKGAISPQRAEQIFRSQSFLQLRYFTPSPIRPLAAGEKQEVRLVYEPSGPFASGVIDALTGEPLKPGEGVGYYGYAKDGMGGMPSASAPQKAEDQLSPEEQAEIEKTGKLISKDEAVAAVKRWVEIPENLVLSNVNLGKDWSSPDARIWSLNWNAPKPDAKAPQYMYARVNAATGELLSFNLSPYGSDSGGKKGMDRQAAQAAAEDFLKQIQPQRFAEVKLTEELSFPGKYGYNGNPESFSYYRLVNGIPFYGNGLNVTVDTGSGKVIGYNLNWSELEFPSTEGILDNQAAVGKFLAARPLTLIYIPAPQPTELGKPAGLRLVYQPMAEDGSMPSNTLDAKSGEFLDYMGRSLTELPKAYQFKDIQGNFAEKEIRILGQAGIFGEYKDVFHPQEAVTTISLLRAMYFAKNGIYGNVRPSNEDIMQFAKNEGWFIEDLSPSAMVNRETFTRIMIRFLKLEPVAKLQGIYQVPYADIDASFSGYAALAKGIGILSVPGPNFNRVQAVTRAEAAYALIKALSFQS